jgi:hypothetical protein
MLRKIKLRALSPCQWARVLVPNYDCWKEAGSRIEPGEEVDICVMPSKEPRRSHPNYFEWHYRVAYKRAGRDYFYTERSNGYLIGPCDFGLISTEYSSPNWDIETCRAHHKGEGTYLYEPASDDLELCPGSDWSRYDCSICGKFVKPFLNDDGDLVCPSCEATGLVILDDELLDKLEREREFARTTGLSKQLEQQLDYLAGYARGDGEPKRQCVLSDDFAPHSFCFSHFVLPKFTADGKRHFWFNGGLIWQGPGAPGDGSFPSLSVSLCPGTGWFCHT